MWCVVRSENNFEKIMWFNNNHTLPPDRDFMPSVPSIPSLGSLYICLITKSVACRPTYAKLSNLSMYYNSLYYFNLIQFTIQYSILVNRC